MANVTTNNSLSLEDINRPFNVGLTVPALLAELEQTFPADPPQRNESHASMIWRGGQVSVVDWIRRRINEDTLNG